MARTLGAPKTGGRKKGTPNKKTQYLLDKLDSHGVDVVAELAALLPQLDANKKADVLTNLMGYLFPKRKSVEVLETEKEPEENVIRIEFVESDGNGNPAFSKSVKVQS